MLAGVGSRFMASLLDGLIQGAVVLAIYVLTLVAAAAGPGPDGSLFYVVVTLAFLGWFLVVLGYHVLFETWASGRTPGKRWTGLRVVHEGGAPVTFTTSAVRNLLRLVDFLPWGYALGVVTMLVTSRNQRLGDLAAGTLVVRERSPVRPTVPAAPQPPAVVRPELAAWDVSSVSADELATVRRFLERRHQLTPEARNRLAWELASRLRAKVAGPPDDLHPELFLADLATVKEARG